jgi:hypothetical protein
MAWIGPYQVVTIQGPVDYASYVVSELPPRPGVFGVAFRGPDGFRSKPVTVRSFVDLPTPLALSAYMKGYKSLQGSIVTVIDDFGEVRPNIIVREVNESRRQKALVSAGGLTPGGTCLLWVDWTLQDISIGY